MRSRILLLLLLLTACTPAQPGPVPSVPNPTATAVTTIPEGETPTPLAASTDLPPLGDWRELPVVPVVPEEMNAIFQAGLAAGRDPTRFSKIGDCQNITTYFLAMFDDPGEYRLGDAYAYLQPTIDAFAGSWSRESLAVHGGMNVAAVQNPFWTLTPRPAECSSGETPLACELRVHNASYAIISMEESWSGDLAKYDQYMRMIVESVLSQKVIPILATRADNLDHGDGINAVVAWIAYDYRVPLWNFWAAAYPLPYHGLTGDGFHLTQARSYFDDVNRMAAGWPWRNLTALQALDAVRNAVSVAP
jgi:hypothetical protein